MGKMVRRWAVAVGLAGGLASADAAGEKGAGVGPAGKGVKLGEATGRLPGIGGRRIVGSASGAGQPTQADRIAGWQAAVDASPGSVEARMGLARALAGAGRCGEALEAFGYYLDRDLRPVAPVFSADEALAAAQCAAQIGAVGLALRYDEIALAEAPDSVRALTVAAIHYDMAGYAADRDWALGELEAGADRGGDPSLHARALIALQRGDLEAFDVCGALWARAGWDRGQWLRLETRLWLDLGDPHTALAGWRAAGAQRRSGARALFAEAQRRAGDAAGALASLQAGSNRGEEDLAAAVLARILVDQGDLAGARAALAGIGAGEADVGEEVAASWWYVAQAAGEEADAIAAARWAARWAALNRSALRRLEQLRPI